VLVRFGSLPTPVVPLPPSPASKLSLFLSLPVCRWSNLLTGEGGGRVGEEPNHTIARMPGPLCNIQYSLSRRMIGQTRDFSGGRMLGEG
jgi:hypothetical protein